MSDNMCSGECGDINGDSLINILDVVIVVNHVLAGTYCQSGDQNDDSGLNILDVVLLINIALTGVSTGGVTALSEDDCGVCGGSNDCISDCSELIELENCTYIETGNTQSGLCYDNECVDTCTIVGNDCANPDSVCQATGVIGDNATSYVCIDEDTYADDGMCPSGLHEKAQGDGHYQCVAPSGLACANKADLALCNYTWGDNAISGQCYSGACLETCTSAGNDCANNNSVCQATGAIGRPETGYVCLPDNQFTANDTCPSGAHEINQNNGSYQCVEPSAVACAVEDDLDGCSYTWGTNDISATCYDGECVTTCSIAGNDCVNSNSVCQATGTIGALGTEYVCIASTEHSSADTCPTGTFALNQGDGNFQCVEPSAAACFVNNDLDACTYTWGLNNVSGRCYLGECIATCTVAGDDCDNPNSVCQATGVIGDVGASYVCIDEDTYANDGTCPSGRHEQAQGDGNYQCVAPSGLACVGQADLALCNYTWGDNAISGQCYDGACLETCTSAGNDCANNNSVCQATGAIGRPETGYVCLPDNQFTANDTCPSGAHEINQNNGSYQCVEPSAVACAVEDDLDGCSYTWGTNDISATCYDGECVTTCSIAGNDCVNSNSVCQATGTIGALGTEYVCIASTEHSSADTCPTGTFALNQGDGNFQCVEPSAAACFVNNDLDACTYTWGLNNVSGRCYLGECIATCTVAGDDCDNPNSVCQATGVIGDVGASYVCIDEDTYANDGTCPSGRHEQAQGDGNYQCVAPSGLACVGQADLALCNYTWGDNAISGQCYDGACLETCTSAGNDCANNNSVCQATGAIGRPETGYVCLPDNQFTANDTCPSGAHEINQNNGSYQCVEPSAVACAVEDDLDGCSYTWGTNDISATCYDGECVTTCSIAGNDCVNSNSVCQATGTIGALGTEYVCIASTEHSSADTCPTGTFALNQGDGNFQCVEPSAAACFVNNDLDACTYTWGLNNVSGRCYLGECIATCTVAGDDCDNPNSVCQATGVIGDVGASYVCIDEDTYANDGTCPSGRHEQAQGDGNYQCVAPSGLACVGQADLALCNYTWGDNAISGQCYDGACLETCTSAGNDCANNNSVCQATGAIGRPETGYVCLPDNQFTANDTCPSGAHEINQNNGSYQCVEPSAVACAVEDDLDGCSYTWGTNDISATCYDGECVTTCSIAGNDCVNSNSVCQATGTIGALGTEYVCIASTEHSSADTCPTGALAQDQGDGNFQCVEPSAIACIGSYDLDQCTYTWGLNNVSGRCYLGECIATCTVAGDDCDNPNSVCQATGVIGDVGAGYVCIDEDTYSEDGTCPSGLHEKAQGDNYQCVAPSGLACVGQADLALCDYTWGVNNINGRCYDGACLATCTSAGNDCANNNSVCQATGAIGRPETEYVCLPDNQFTANDTCPSGTHEINQNNGNYQCVEPSAVACAAKDNLDDCSYSWGTNNISATCYDGECVATCSISGNDCANENSVCYATAAIGVPGTEYVCLPDNQFTANDTCPLGTHAIDQGSNIYQCVAPRAQACPNDAADDTPCSYNWGVNFINGSCDGGLCIDHDLFMI